MRKAIKHVCKNCKWECEEDYLSSFCPNLVCPRCNLGLMYPVFSETKKMEVRNSKPQITVEDILKEAGLMK